MLSVTATELPRLMACNGSRLIGGHVPPITRDTTIRDEGNAAHWLVEQVHSGAFTTEELIDRKAPNGVYITAEMVEYLGEYLSVVTQGGFIELDTSHAEGSYEVNGRADHAVIEDDMLEISDLKYGWGLIEPEMNWTLISHAIGWLIQHRQFYIDRIKFTIYQPRPEHHAGRVRSWTVNRDQLDGLWQQLSNTLSNPNDQLNTTVHCAKCPNIAICPAARLAELNGIDASEKAFVDTIDNTELSFRLDQNQRAIKLLTERDKAYKDLALHRIKSGEIVNNFSVAQDLANTSWKSGVTVDMMQAMAGTELDIIKKQLKTPNQVKKAGVPEELVDAFTERRVKGSKLVRMDANTKAMKMLNK